MLQHHAVKQAAGKFLAGLVVLGLGAFGGAALRISSASSEPATNRIASLGAPVPFEVEQAELAELVIEESARPVAAVVTNRPAAGSSAPTRPAAPKASRTAKAVAPALAPAGPSARSATVACDRLDDAKINWLLRLVAKTKAANPSDAAVADSLDAHLRTALGKGMCAEEAQTYISNMCADPAVFSFMQKMVKELPFFVRPLVGNPCTQDLVQAAQKYLP